MEKKKEKTGLSRLSVIALILVACIFCGAITGCTTEEQTTPKTTGGAQGGETTGAESGGNSSFSIPGTLNCEYFDITIVSAEVYDTITLDSGIDVEFTPDEGKQFLVLRIDAKNTSDEVRNVGTFSCYVDNITVLVYNVLGKYDDRSLFVGAVDPEKTMQCYAMWQVPVDWEVFELSYVENSLSGWRSDLVSIYRSDIAE